MIGYDCIYVKRCELFDCLKRGDKVVVVFMGPCCTGKSSVAELIREKTNIQVVTGKDYLRLSTNEDEAWELFLNKIETAIHANPHSNDSIIYIMDDAERVEDLLRIRGVQCVKFSATIDAIKDRYEARMQGELPGVVVKMLNRQKEAWDMVECPIKIDSSQTRKLLEMAQEVVDKLS